MTSAPFSIPPPALTPPTASIRASRSGGTSTTPQNSQKGIDPFDGTPSDYDAWRRRLKIYFALHDTQMNSSEKKILFALSTMKEGNAAAFSEAYVDQVSEVTPDWGTWPNFITQLDKTFKSSDAIRQAIYELEQLKQKDLTAEAFFFKFNNLR
jgi:hypothetical protein